MQLPQLPGNVHLTYCTNIHGGESWADVRASLEHHLPQIKAGVCPHAPMGIGLRLSAIAADALAEPNTLAEFRSFLARHELYVFTINAFPYGDFHGRRVKEDVYLPDWRSCARLAYSDRSAEILAALLPDGMVGSVSTVPGAFKPLAEGPQAVQTIAGNFARHAASLAGIQARTGREIVLAIEPEPCCMLETTEETIDFFKNYVFSDASARIVAELAGLTPVAARSALQRHIGVCYDICHGAVEFEDPASAFAAFTRAGIRIAKLQLSAALRVLQVDEATETLLSAFDDGVYLHQVVQRRDGALSRFVDLPAAFAALRDGSGGGEWRVHCHVPIFLERAGRFDSTQPILRAVLAQTRSAHVSPHLEVETYTWDVLPRELCAGDRVDDIVRELEWVIRELQ